MPLMIGAREEITLSVRLPNGATIEIAATYGTNKVMNAASNANPCVASLDTGHNVGAGDIIEVTSGWAQLNARIVKAGTPTGDNIPLVGIDTSDTTRFPAGTGTGSVREVLTWQQISQVLDLATAGGEQQFVTYEFLESSDQFQMPTTRSPQSMTFHIADDSSLPHYTILQAADQDRAQRALRVNLPGGSKIYYNAYITLNPTPSMTKGEVMALAVTCSMLALPVRY